MNSIDLNEVVDANANDRQEVYGVFDAERIPPFVARVFEKVKNFKAAVSPDCSFRLIRDALNDAQNTIDLYIYNLSAEHLLNLLQAAKGRGVTVRIMYDVMDTRGNEKDKIRQLDVETKEAPSSGRRKVFTVCHQKFAVIDEKALLIGSANWAASAIPEVNLPGRFKKGNREWLAHIEDEDVAEWFANLFQADWEIPELESPQGAVELEESPILEGIETRFAAVTIPEEIFDIESFDGDNSDIKITPILSPENYFKTVCDLIRNAQTSIDIEQQYIVAGGSKTQALIEELAARKNEVEIRIIISPAFKKNWDKSIETLEAADLLDCTRAINLDSFTHLHNKGVLVDGKFTIVTSTNMSENSITQAREAGLLIESAEIGGYYKKVIDVDWSSGIDPADVPQHLAVIEDALSKVDEPLLEIHPADERMI